MGSAESNRLPGMPVADGVQAPVKAPELTVARAMRAMAAIENVPSPCLSVCRMSELTAWCEGCYRTLDEIGQWSSADGPAKRMIWGRIAQRINARPS